MPIVIFEGPDRVGKTTIAEAYAKRFGVEPFVSNSKEAFAGGIFSDDTRMISSFNLMIAKYASDMVSESIATKPIVIYRSFMSEMVYSEVLDRKTNVVQNIVTDVVFANAKATIVLCGNGKTSDFKDDQLDDTLINKAAKQYDRLKKVVLTDIYEIDTSDQDVEKYVDMIIEYLDKKQN